MQERSSPPPAHDGLELPPEHAGLPGTLIGPYRVDFLIGQGGMGTVWSATHTVLSSRVAIKFIRPAYANNAEARARFEIEARAAASVSSAHAVKVFDYGLTDTGLPFLVMEYLEGESLSQVLARRGPLPAAEVFEIIGTTAKALEKAHAAGVVHRDLKPDNIFLATNDDVENGRPYVVKIVDFGIAKLIEIDEFGEQMGGPTRTGAVIGTPNFMAPEQLTVGGDPGPLTDLWSLGACAFTAMTARLPFEGSVLGDIVLRVCVHPLPVPTQINPNVPPDFDAWFARACNRTPEERFHTATELADTLAVACGVAKAPLTKRETEYALKKAPATTATAPLALDDEDMPRAMSTRTAFLAGLLLMGALAVAAGGIVAWRAKVDAEEIDGRDHPTTTGAVGAPAVPAPSIAPSTPPSPVPSASPSAKGKGKANSAGEAKHDGKRDWTKSRSGGGVRGAHPSAAGGPSSHSSEGGARGAKPLERDSVASNENNYAAARRRSWTRIRSKLGASSMRARRNRNRAWWTSRVVRRSGRTVQAITIFGEKAYAAPSSSPFDSSKYASASSSVRLARVLITGVFIHPPRS